MDKADEVRLRHMLDAARDAIIFTAGRERNILDSNRMLVLSLVKSNELPRRKRTVYQEAL